MFINHPEYDFNTGELCSLLVKDINTAVQRQERREAAGQTGGEKTIRRRLRCSALLFETLGEMS